MIDRLLKSLGILAGLAGVYLTAVFLASLDTDLSEGGEWILGVPLAVAGTVILVFLGWCAVTWWKWVRGDGET